MQACLRPFALALVTSLFLSPALALEARAQGVNGTLGLFFDDRGENCSINLAPGRSATLWVLLIPEGDTRGGITGAEFRIDTGGAPGYVFSNEEVRMPNGLIVGGPAVGPGLNVASIMGCERGLPLPLLRLQVQNVGGGRDAVLRIAAKSPPGNKTLDCPLVTLCDDPVFTAICMEIGPKNVAVLNPTGAVPCGLAGQSSEWGAVKELYR